MNTHICQHVKITELEGRADIHRAVVEDQEADQEDQEAVQAEAVVQVDLRAVAAAVEVVAVEALEVVLVGPRPVFQGAVVRRMEAMGQEATTISKLFNLDVSSLRGTSF